jgi:hypothetical protein
MSIYGGVLKRVMPSLMDKLRKLNSDELAHECSVNDAMFERDLAYLESLGASDKLLEELCTLYVGNAVAISLLTADTARSTLVSYLFDELCACRTDAAELRATRIAKDVDVTDILGL